jgi:hypothetical protein
LKNAPLALKDFHELHPEAPGPPVRLQDWLQAAEEDRFIDDEDDDDVPVTDARGRASSGGGSNVTAGPQ